MSQPLTHNPTSAATTTLASLCTYDRAAITAGIVHFGVGGFTALTKPCTSTG
jgi:hypothetical protein